MQYRQITTIERGVKNYLTKRVSSMFRAIYGHVTLLSLHTYFSRTPYRKRIVFTTERASESRIRALISAKYRANVLHHSSNEIVRST